MGEDKGKVEAMSADSLWAELQQALRDNQLLRARLSGVKNENDDLKGLQGQRRRRYGPDQERDEEGRAISICIGCHRRTSIRARGFCGSCYEVWRRKSRKSRGLI